MREANSHRCLVEEDGQYLWGSKEDAVVVTKRQAMIISDMTAFKVFIEKAC
jgi:hypothetical protein